MVSWLGCGVLLVDVDGVVLDLWVMDGDQGVFDCWGLVIGFDWFEVLEGINGIGICIVEGCYVIIY